MPAIQSYAASDTHKVTDAIEAARKARVDNVELFLQRRFTKSQARAIQAAHLSDEERPIETLWDVAVGATAYARGLSYQDDRVAIEREAGKIMALASE